jgi:hypothetical protein
VADPKAVAGASTSSATGPPQYTHAANETGHIVIVIAR